MTRNDTIRVEVGNVPIGAGAPVSVQSMTTADTRDPRATAAQVNELAAAGCEIVRLAVPDQEAADALPAILAATEVPLVADIHFDYRLALAALEAGIHKLRINPGNIGSEVRVAELAAAAKSRGVPIRIGVNAGSLPKSLVDSYGRTSRAMVEAALWHIGLLEKAGFDQIVVSMKASDVARTVEAYTMLAERVRYPLHVGVTEAGPPPEGLVKSSVGIGIILGQGIGDTIRVSLTGDHVAEVSAGRQILEALGLRRFGPTIVSCPTCARRRADIVRIADEVRSRIAGVTAPITIAVMGCEVNGPGEAADADVGLACGNGCGLVFRHGRIVRKADTAHMVEALVEAVLEEAGSHQVD
ncbi:MAG: 4-hydroxy-3-methylbut-2-en-1-yl diphosphate synthase [Firmicutes bacterium ADurb.Bin506]|jgi:(E)-4-hydroxy-3-methylbut-2-enyl-diphosphate synthase|nr:MAG: 4-hydroxy-3-methylbut-2-en-1-yl diphosphate synthase [Firmicutes bacterium ADurb.Bin506]